MGCEQPGAVQPLVSPFDRKPESYPRGMLIVHVHVKVKPDQVKAFLAATLANAQASRNEPGMPDSTSFSNPTTQPALSLRSVRTLEAPEAHKRTPHYATWRDTVAEMMAEPRRGVKLANIDPPDASY